MEPDVTAVQDDATADPHRRRAAHLYGLIVTGAVLTTASDDLLLRRVTLILLGTLAIYWAAETYVHWSAARAHVGRALRREERRMIMLDGWPMVAASLVPLICLAVAAVLGLKTSVAVNVTLALDVVLLVITGWQMGRDGGLTGTRLVVSSAIAGCLGVALIVLKSLLH